MNTPFFQFLLYILLVILTYFLVRNISKKVHESFDNHGLPPALEISGKLDKNNLHLYFLLPEVTNQATGVKVIVDSIQDKSVFYKIDELKMEKNIYTLTLENLPYDKTSKVQLQLMSQWGLGAKSNTLEITPNSKQVLSDILEKKKEKMPISQIDKSEKYVSCHPDGTYTIHKNFVINPPLINNLSPQLLKDLQETLKPKEKTYEVEINLE